MGLTQQQKAAREGKLTASRVAALMTGNREEIMKVWRELCGDDHAFEDLSDNWPVQLGIATEKVNLDWYEHKHGRKLTQRGKVVVHKDYPWAAATLDGFDEGLPGPVETKHVGGFEKRDTVIQRYMPQLHWQMEVTGTQLCAISIIEGAKAPVVEVIPFNKDYADVIMSRAHKFMQHVWDMTPPVDMSDLTSVAPELMKPKEYDMTGRNDFAVLAFDWLNNKAQAKTFDTTVEAIKKLVPYDAGRLTGYGIVVVKDKAGRISIREDRSAGSFPR